VAGHHRLAVADPHLARVVPVWLDALRQSGASAVAILAYRPPGEAALSLERLTGIPAAEGLLIWLRDVLDAEIATILGLGIELRSNTMVGEKPTLAELRAEFDAIVLCGGATRPRDLAVPGRELAGIHFAVQFLGADTRSMLDDDIRASGWISARHKDVIVIGGGDTGTDCVATALRHGCNSVTQFEILPELPPRRLPGNPWPEWPRVRRTDYGQEEAQITFGRDPRQYCVQTKRFVGDDQGRVREVQTVRVEVSRDERGGLKFVEIPGSEQTWPAQLVLIAMGFLGPEDTVLNQLGVARDARSNAQAEYGKFATNVPGVFAAGDMRRGQSLVVWAIREGRDAAAMVDRYLMAG
jgi:glutamate synthase (NADPH/NADH) small chain